MKPDAPRAVRAGEELDLLRLGEWLRSQSLPWQGLTVEQYPRGHSNLTYRVTAPGAAWVLRRPPVGSKVAHAHDMVREARILVKLHPVFPLAPRVVAVCEEAEVLGAPFYLMDPVRGAILRGAAPREPLSAGQVRALCGAFVQTLVDLHAVDFRKAGLEGKPEGYVRRQVDGWTRRWHDARTDEVPDVDAIARWLSERIPPEQRAAFLHNDFKYDNLVLDPLADPARVVGVLDWEMSTAGDPLMDLGTALGYWVEEGDPEPLKTLAFGPTFLPGSFTRAQLAAEYGRLSGRDVSGMLFYYCFALFKTAVVVQQIYQRYLEGLTHDERFASFGIGVQILARSAVEAAERGTY